MPSFTLGVFGAGVVGGGVMEVLKTKAAEFDKIGFEFKVKTICVRDVNKARDFETPAGCKFVTTKEGASVEFC
jgi:homoserine dehydrogenase